MSSIKENLILSAKQLSAVSDTAKLDSELLLAFVLNKPRSYLYTWEDETLSQNKQNTFDRLVARRVKGEPIAHIVGERGFWSLDLTVTVDTLIPRPDTERLVELALEMIPEHEKWNILDMGTGTGAIALSLAKERPLCFITATDQSLAALDIAKQNAKRNNITNIAFVQSDWFAQLKNRQFDMIISNPPYIGDNDPHLQKGDVRFEPLSALASGEDGLNAIRTIIHGSQPYLRHGAALLLEHGYDQAGAVCGLLKEANFKQIRNVKDYGDNPRVSIGYFK